jgi:hypothetical protein
LQNDPSLQNLQANEPMFQFPFLNVSKEGFSSKINLKHLRAMLDLLESSEDVLQVPRLWENVAAWLEVEGPSPNS